MSTVIDPGKGGPAQPVRPVVLSPVRMRDGRFMVGHTRSFTDPDAPILIEESEVRTGPGEVDALCRTCAPRSQLGRLGADTLLLVEHQPGCRALRKLAAKAAQR